MILHPLVLLLTAMLLLPGGAALSSRVPGAGPAGADSPSQTLGTWGWPVTGPVIRAFDPPESPFGAGHRGIDIAAAPGTTMFAPESGTVTFSGTVGGLLFLTIDHGGELSSTYSWISSASVRKGDLVVRGQPLGTTGTGHPGAVVPHLHFGVKLAGAYVDPFELLGPMGVDDLIRLVPVLA